MLVCVKAHKAIKQEALEAHGIEHTGSGAAAKKCWHLWLWGTFFCDYAVGTRVLGNHGTWLVCRHTYACIHVTLLVIVMYWEWQTKHEHQGCKKTVSWGGHMHDGGGMSDLLSLVKAVDGRCDVPYALQSVAVSLALALEGHSSMR